MVESRLDIGDRVEAATRRANNRPTLFDEFELAHANAEYMAILGACLKEPWVELSWDVLADCATELGLVELGHWQRRQMLAARVTWRRPDRWIKPQEYLDNAPELVAASEDGWVAWRRFANRSDGIYWMDCERAYNDVACREASKRLNEYHHLFDNPTNSSQP